MFQYVGRALPGVALAVLVLHATPPTSAQDGPAPQTSNACGRCGRPAGRFNLFGHTCRVPATCVPPAPGYAPATPLYAPGTSMEVPGTIQPVAPFAPPPSSSQYAPTAGSEAGAAVPSVPQPGAPAAPGAAPGAAPAPGGASAADAAAPALASGLGGGLSEPQGALNMFGDLQPYSLLQQRAVTTNPNPIFGHNPLPPAPPRPTHTTTHEGPFGRNRSTVAFPSIRNFKFIDNQTPMPVDRLTYSFNFFDYVNQSINQRLGVPINRIQVYRYNFGFEKTFLDKNASFGMRLPLYTVDGASSISGVGRTRTALGDLSVYVKYALFMDRPAGRVVSTGLAVTAPTGPSSLGGANYIRGLNYTQLQPFLAFQWTWGRLYTIGSTAINVPTSARDATTWFNDISLGYFVYRNADPTGFLTSIAPTLEVHSNTPMNHTDFRNYNDIAGTAQSVNITSGLNFFFYNRAVLSMGVADPITGPRPFSLEALMLLNVFF